MKYHSMVYAGLLAVGLLHPAGAQPVPALDMADDIAAIKSILEAQAAAWNRGDIDGFMQHYWDSDQLVFCSGAQRRRGWATVRARYKQRYSTPEQMGKLTFSALEFQPLCDTAVLVIGDWQLDRAEDRLGGNFSLILRKLDDRWVIVHDHTSAQED